MFIFFTKTVWQMKLVWNVLFLYAHFRHYGQYPGIMKGNSSWPAIRTVVSQRGTFGCRVNHAILWHHMVSWYCEHRKRLATQKLHCNYPKIWTVWLYHRVMHLKDAEQTSCLMTKPTKWHVRPVKTHRPWHPPSPISLRCPHEESLGL